MSCVMSKVTSTSASVCSCSGVEQDPVLPVYNDGTEESAGRSLSREKSWSDASDWKLYWNGMDISWDGTLAMVLGITMFCCRSGDPNTICVSLGRQSWDIQL